MDVVHRRTGNWFDALSDYVMDRLWIGCSSWEEARSEVDMDASERELEGYNSELDEVWM
jgi:hypothetical protein